MNCTYYHYHKIVTLHVLFLTVLFVINYRNVWKHKGCAKIRRSRHFMLNVNSHSREQIQVEPTTRTYRRKWKSRKITKYWSRRKSSNIKTGLYKLQQELTNTIPRPLLRCTRDAYIFSSFSSSSNNNHNVATRSTTTMFLKTISTPHQTKTSRNIATASSNNRLCRASYP